MSLFNFTGNSNLTLKNITSDKKHSLINVFWLVEKKTNQLKENYDIGVSFQLEALRLSYSLLSLPKAPFPDIKFADNLATKMAKIADVQASHPFIELLIYHKKAQFNRLDLIAVIPIQNKGIVGYADLLKPYLTTGDVKLLGEDDELLVAINLNGQVLDGNDWLQIECDYSCVVSGTTKKQNPLVVNNYDNSTTTTLFEDTTFFANNPNYKDWPNAIKFIDADIFYISQDYLKSRDASINNDYLFFYAYLVNNLQITKIEIENGVTDLTNLVINLKVLITHLNLTSVNTLLTSSLNINLPELKDLNYLNLSNTQNKNDLDFSNIIQNTDLIYLNLANCTVSSLKVDEAFIALDDRGLTNGEARFTGSTSIMGAVSVASQVARDNLVLKGWSLYYNS